jgi:hypothetical protein
MFLLQVIAQLVQLTMCHRHLIILWICHLGIPCTVFVSVCTVVVLYCFVKCGLCACVYVCVDSVMTEVFLNLCVCVDFVMTEVFLNLTEVLHP